MIFITVGTHTQQFNRLIKEVDNLVKIGVIKDHIIAQIGNSNYIPKNIEYRKFLPEEERNKILKTAKLVITHGGAGSIIDVLSTGKKPIVVPRLKELGEHINNHQLDLCKKLEEQDKIEAIYDIRDLKRHLKPKNTINTSKSKTLLPNLKQYLIEIDDKL
jgi:UDP-N-acetylglucosamine transferase subunit ALG13